MENCIYDEYYSFVHSIIYLLRNPQLATIERIDITIQVYT